MQKENRPLMYITVYLLVMLALAFSVKDLHLIAGGLLLAAIGVVLRIILVTDVEYIEGEDHANVQKSETE